MAVSREQRRMVRKKQRLRVDFGKPGQARDNLGYTEDISPFGLFVSTRKSQELGQELLFEVHLPDGSALLQGIVAWRRSSSREVRSFASSGFGVRLLSAPEEWYQYLMGAA